MRSVYLCGLAIGLIGSFAAIGCANESAESGSGAGGTGGTGGGAVTGGTAGVGGSGVPKCPTTLPNSGECDPTAQGCTYTVDCQSGAQTFTLSCHFQHPGDPKGYGWTVAAKACDPGRPYDSCPGTFMYCDSATGWEHTVSSDTPASCPSAVPAAGEKCNSNPFGGADSPCGYPCDAGGKPGWRLASCAKGDGGLVWEVSQKCE